MDKFYRVSEGEPAAMIWNLPTFKYAKGPFNGPSHQHTAIK
jgi:hypothetical protein